VKENCINGRIASNDAKSVCNLLCLCTAANIKEVGRLSTVVLHDVHSAHGQSGTVNDTADFAFQLNIVQLCLAGLTLQGSFFSGVAHGFNFGVSAEGIVIKVHLCIGGDNFVRTGNDKGVNLGQGAIFIQECLVQTAHYADKIFTTFFGNVYKVSHVVDLVVGKSGNRMHANEKDFFRC